MGCPSTICKLQPCQQYFKLICISFFEIFISILLHEGIWKIKFSCSCKSSLLPKKATIIKVSSSILYHLYHTAQITSRCWHSICYETLFKDCLQSIQRWEEQAFKRVKNRKGCLMSSVSSALLEKGNHSQQLLSTGLNLCHYVTNCVQKRTAHILTPASKEAKPTN